MLAGDHTIDVVRGAPEAEFAEAMVRFWTRWSGRDESLARSRIRDAVCALTDPVGELAGISSASEAEIPLLGGRTLWLCRLQLAPTAPEGAALAMLAATRDELERDFVPGEGPIGVCAAIADRELLARHPEAVWEQARMFYAGYTTANVQVRVSYFDGARV